MPNNKKIKVLHVIYSFNLGGMESVLVELINNMDDTRFENVICCLTQNGNASERLKNRALKIYECHKKEGLDFSIINKIKEIVNNEDIDIIHGRAWVSLIPCMLTKLLSKKKVKLIIGYHGQNYSEKEIKGRNVKRMILQKILLRFVDIVYTLNNRLKVYYSYQTGIDKNKILVIPNGLDLVTQNHEEKELDLLRIQYNIDREDIVIGFIGRLDKVKNLSLLIEAFSMLNKNISRTKLVIVGSGADENNLKDLAERLSIKDKVVFTGWSDIPNIYYELMHIYAQPSLFEGMSGAIARAMLYQLPVVTTNVGGNPDLVVSNQTGYLIAPEDKDQLLAALVKLANSPELRYKLGAAGSQFIKEHYSLITMVNKYQNLYLSLTGQTK